MDRLKRWLSDFPTTAARILTTIGMAWGTSLVVGYCFVRQIPLDDRVFSSWLIFLAAMAGIDTAHFGIKRATAWKPPVTPSEVPGVPGVLEAPGDVEAVSPQLADTETHRAAEGRIAPMIDGPQAIRPIGAPNPSAERYGDERAE